MWRSCQCLRLGGGPFGCIGPALTTETRAGQGCTLTQETDSVPEVAVTDRASDRDAPVSSRWAWGVGWVAGEDERLSHVALKQLLLPRG